MSRAGSRPWQPEVALAGFAFLLHFPWEMLQVPLYETMPNLPHWEAVKMCLRATAGDVGITLLGFWVVAALWHRRTWVVESGLRPLGVMVLVLTGLNVVGEWLSVDIWRRWEYAGSMPTLPLLRTGGVPLLQWLLLPPLSMWLARRHLT